MDWPYFSPLNNLVSSFFLRLFDNLLIFFLLEAVFHLELRVLVDRLRRSHEVLHLCHVAHRDREVDRDISDDLQAECEQFVVDSVLESDTEDGGCK